MVNIKFNKNKIIPRICDYVKIIISALFVYYVVRFILIKIFPVLGTLSEVCDLIIWTVIILYLKDLIDIKIGNMDYF